MIKNKYQSSILIIDNNLSILYYISKTLEKVDYRILKAFNCLNGIAQVIKSIPELIFPDITLPDIDGYNTCKLLKKNQKTKRIPVIVMNCNFSPEDRKKALKAGTVDFLTKPIRKNELQGRLEVHLRLNKNQLNLSPKSKKPDLISLKNMFKEENDKGEL